MPSHPPLEHLEAFIRQMTPDRRVSLLNKKHRLIDFIGWKCHSNWKFFYDVPTYPGYTSDDVVISYYSIVNYQAGPNPTSGSNTFRRYDRSGGRGKSPPSASNLLRPRARRARSRSARHAGQVFHLPPPGNTSGKNNRRGSAGVTMGTFSKVAGHLFKNTTQESTDISLLLCRRLCPIIRL